MNVVHTLLSLPVAIWTVALGVSLIYWLFVMVGVVHLGEGSDGALEAGAKGAAEALGHSADVGDVGDGGTDLGAEGGGDGDHEAGFLAALLGALNLRKVPATLSLSLLVFFSWAGSLLMLQGASAWLHGTVPAYAQWLCTVLFAPMLALPLTGMIVRPLAPLFTHKKAKSSKDMIGRICVVRTGEVTETFGEAVVKDTGSDLVLRVRVEGTKLRRGEEGLIVGWDPEREEYLVEPLEQDLRSKT